MTDDTAATVAQRLDQIGGSDADAEPMLRLVVASFLDRTPEDLAHLNEAVSDHDTEAVAAQAHRLRGTALNLGADRLADGCAELEAAGRSGHLEQGENLMIRVRGGYSDVEAVLCGHLAGWERNARAEQ